VQFLIPCSSAAVPGKETAKAHEPVDSKLDVPAPSQPGTYHITVALQYRKVDQFLLNFLFGATNQLTSPVTEVARATTTVEVSARPLARK
jgi:hypothetical protein